MGGSLLLGGEQARGFHHVLGADLTPGDLSRVHLGKHLDGLAVHGDAVFGIADLALELAMHGVIAQHIGHVVGGHAGVIDANELDVLTRHTGTENQPADAAKTVDANLDAHSFQLLIMNRSMPGD